MNFSKENVALFIAAIGILSVVAQVHELPLVLQNKIILMRLPIRSRKEKVYFPAPFLA
jgi:hypothetical protein